MKELNDSVSAFEQRQHELNVKNDEALKAAPPRATLRRRAAKPEAEKTFKEVSDRNKKTGRSRNVAMRLQANRERKLLHEDRSSDSGLGPDGRGHLDRGASSRRSKARSPKAACLESRDRKITSKPSGRVRRLRAPSMSRIQTRASDQARSQYQPRQGTKVVTTTRQE